MSTEDVSLRHVMLDDWPVHEAIEAMWEGQLAAVAAVRPALPAITSAIEDAAVALGGSASGRLVYVGAGTSGRVAVQDGAELPPTYDWPLERLVFAMAGGQGALTASAEGAEDAADDGESQIASAGIGPADVVIAVAASGSTPFTVAATRAAAARGAVTIGIANNAETPLLATARHKILIDTGPELVAGSTRMKAGTAQKVVLNLISTGVMVRLGRVYSGMMVNMHPSNIKLRRRAAQMVASIAQCSEARAQTVLAENDGDIKRAVLVVLGADRTTALRLLSETAGNLRHALHLMGKVPVP